MYVGSALARALHRYIPIDWDYSKMSAFAKFPARYGSGGGDI